MPKCKLVMKLGGVALPGTSDEIKLREITEKTEGRLRKAGFIIQTDYWNWTEEIPGSVFPGETYLRTRIVVFRATGLWNTVRWYLYQNWKLEYLIRKKFKEVKLGNLLKGHW